MSGRAIFAGGVLIPVRCLINETTIAQTPVETITYYHVELDSHDIVLTEGLAVESYLETGGRDTFANGGVVTRMIPEVRARLARAVGEDARHAAAA